MKRKLRFLEKISYLFKTKRKMESKSIERNDDYFKSEEFYDRLKGSIFGQFIGDSLAMPVHWYYDTNKLKEDFGEIRECFINLIFFFMEKRNFGKEEKITITITE